MSDSKCRSVPGAKPSFSSARNTLERSSSRMTIDSPCMVGIVETRMSTRRPGTVTRMRPSWGSRRSAMFISAISLMREVTAACSRRGADDQLPREPGELAEVVHDDGVQRVGRGDGQLAVLDAHGAHGVLPEVLCREVLDDGQRRRQLVAGQIGEVLLLRERTQHLLALDRAERHERLAQALAGRLGAREGFLHDVRGGQAFLDQDLAETAKKRCDDHAMLA